ASLASKSRGHSGNALDFSHRVHTEIRSLSRRAALFTEVDTARQLADKNQINTLQHLCLEGGSVDQTTMQLDRAEIGIDAQFLTQPEQPLLGSNLGIRCRPLGATNGAQQHSICPEAGLQRGGGQGIAERIDGSTTERQSIQLELMAVRATNSFQT